MFIIALKGMFSKAMAILTYDSGVRNQINCMHKREIRAIFWFRRNPQNAPDSQEKNISGAHVPGS